MPFPCLPLLFSHQLSAKWMRGSTGCTASAARGSPAAKVCPAHCRGRRSSTSSEAGPGALPRSTPCSMSLLVKR